jgi:hypothetical protein
MKAMKDFYQRLDEIGAPRCLECGHFHFISAAHIDLGLAPYREVMPPPDVDEAEDVLEIAPEIATVLDSVEVDEVPEPA